jgi:thioredoxin-like negative regulator of GroEL
MFFAHGEKVDEILGAVPEHIIRAKVAEILERFPTDEKGSLKVLLTSWIDQNSKHSDKFKKWKEKTGNSEGGSAYGPVFEAVKQVEKANGQLFTVLAEIQEKL